MAQVNGLSIADDLVETVARALAICRLRRRFGPAVWDGMLSSIKSVEVDRLMKIGGHELCDDAAWALYAAEQRGLVLSRETDAARKAEFYAAVAGYFIRERGGEAIIPSVGFAEIKGSIMWRAEHGEDDGDAVMHFRYITEPIPANN